MKNALLTTFLLLASITVSAQQQNIPIPSNAQIRWHNYERTMFIHFGPATWQGREYDNLTTPLSSINPTQLNTDQWCEVAKSWGAKMILFVAKHTGGFCWWDTKTVEHNVMNTPYGKDVMAELSASCKKYGLDLGVYIYPGDDSFGAGIGSGGITEDPARQDEYTNIFRTQLKEILSNYGHLTEIWFDGSCNIYINDILEDYKDDAVIFQGPLASIRWMGNEDGIAPDPNWGTISKKDLETGVSTAVHSSVNGDVYAPTEADVPFLKNGGHKWFWAPGIDSLIMTKEQFLELYYKSVGRSSVLLLNSTPDTTGLIPASHASQYKIFGQEIEKRFGTPIASTRGTGNTITINLKKPTTINHTILQEDLTKGQRVLKYDTELSADGKNWTKVYSGTAIGHKKIDFFPRTEAKYVRVTFKESKDTPQIKNFALFCTEQDMSFNSKNEEKSTIGSWNKDTFSSEEWLDYTVDLTPYVNAIGEYEIIFSPISSDYTQPAGLEFKDWNVEMYGNKNNSGIVYENGIFRITRSQQTLDEFKTIFNVKVMSKKGYSTGEINIKRITF